MTQAELGAFVESHLREKSIDVVLSGRAAVGIYTEGKYVSQDLDMVRGWGTTRRATSAAMQEIGFKESQGRYFRHADSEHLVEFLPGPLTVGDELVAQIDEIEFMTGTLRVISPTDCVKDRLASYHHFKDRQGLVQAIMAARQRKVDIREIRRWSQGEGELDRFKDLMVGLGNAE